MAAERESHSRLVRGPSFQVIVAAEMMALGFTAAAMA